MSRDNDVAALKEWYEKKLEDARSKERRAQEELKSFKQRMAGVLPLSIQAGDTEDMTSPVNKSRLQDMFDQLRVIELPKVAEQLAEKGNDPQAFQQLVQNAFEEAASLTCGQMESINEMFPGKWSNREVPHKVKEYINASKQSLQMAFYHCDKEDLHCSAVKEAPEVSRELLYKCYWLGCLMGLNKLPIQPNWSNHHKGMDPWDILPRDLTHIPQKPKPTYERNIDRPNEGAAHKSRSISSDWSIGHPIDFTIDSTSHGNIDRPNEGAAHKSRSISSDWSIEHPIDFTIDSTSHGNTDRPNEGAAHKSRSASSDWSIGHPIDFTIDSTSHGYSI